MERRDAFRISALASLISLVFYLPRVAPTLTLMGDSAVFVTTAATFGVPQPSGYPLWTALGFAFSKLPLGDVAHRLHLMSALLHALTVYVVARIIADLTDSRVGALAGALWLAFSRAFFLGSLYAEVFPLNDLFTALLLWLALDVNRAPKNPVLLALVVGLASAHHQTIALLAPALAVLLYRARSELRLPKLFAMFLAPIVFFYALIPLAARREPLSSWGDVRSFSALVALVTRRDYGGLFSPHLGSTDLDRSTLVLGWIEGTLLSFTGWVLLFLAVGAFALWRSNKVAGLALGLALVVTGPVFAVMNRLEIETEHGRAFAERFSTQSAIPLAIVAGAGIGFAYRLLRTELPATWLRVALGLTGIIPLVRHAEDVDQRNNRRGLQVAHDLLLEVPDGSLVLLTGDAVHGAALYLCAVEKRCGRTLMFSPGQMHLAWRVEQLRRRNPDLALPAPMGKFLTVREIVAANLERRPVFLSPQLLDLEPPLRDTFDLLPAGLMIRALRPNDVEPFKRGFVDRARRLGGGEGCEGCAMKRSTLVAPSLEVGLPFLYALAYENHARVLGAYFEEPALAALLASKAEQADPDPIRKLRAGP